VIPQRVDDAPAASDRHRRRDLGTVGGADRAGRREMLYPAVAIWLVVVNLRLCRAPLYRRLGNWGAPYAPDLLGLGEADARLGHLASATLGA